ncbi:hypothetical protein AB0M45_21715 [Nocardia sp. NPDC051787]|uniref:hypothetical protein n=1 Tax=Nocardia sp. NPDC051787 TaxID=3155415 RepID=UPI0034446936
MNQVNQDADVVSVAQTEFVDALDGFLADVRAFSNAVEDAGYGWGGRARDAAVGKGISMRDDGEGIIALATDLVEMLGISKNDLIATEEENEQTYTTLV